MKESMWGYLIVILGVVIIAILMLVQRLTTTNEEDYYLSREVLKSAMLDAVDYGSYMKTGKLVMSREKFVAVFIRRFADSVTADKDYRIDFYDIYEYPPKATIRITTATGNYSVNNEQVNLEINTFITGILETNDKDGLFSTIYSISADIDGVNGTNINDSRLILSYLSSGSWDSNITDTGKANADVNKDGVVDYIDASIIERSILSSYKQGDVNMDGKIDESDLNYLKQNASFPDKANKILADVNCDGQVDNSDIDALDSFLKNEKPFLSSYIKGDVNGDGRITALDVEVLSGYIKNRTTLTESQLERADLDNNNKANVADLVKLTKMLTTGKYKYE